MICNKKTTWCCAACSDGALQLFPLCPHQTNYKGDISARGCLEKHWENPACKLHAKGAVQDWWGEAEEGWG